MRAPRLAALAATQITLAVLPLGGDQPTATAQDMPCAAPAEAPNPGPPTWAGELRRFATGTGVRVAVVDTGVSPNPELDQLAPGADLVTPDTPDPLFDCDGHGTVVAGIIGATTTGIAPDAEILAVRQTSAHYRNRNEGDDVETAGSLRSLADAIHAALDEHSRVINISVVSCVDSRDVGAIDTGVLDGALTRAEVEGAVVVAAAGNVTSTCAQGSHVFPSHFPTVVAVGARDTSHTVADFSVAPPAGSPALSAPGTAEFGLSWAGGGYARGSVPERDSVTPFTGTSFAAPIVSGAVALLLERHPTLSPAEVRTVLGRVAEPAGGALDPLAVVTAQPVPPRQQASAAYAPLVVTPTQGRASGADTRGAGAGLALLGVALLTGGALALARRR